MPFPGSPAEHHSRSSCRCPIQCSSPKLVYIPMVTVCVSHCPTVSHCVCWGEGPKDGLSLGWCGAEVKAGMCQAASLPVPGGRMLRDDRGAQGNWSALLGRLFFFFLIKLVLANLVNLDENTFYFFFGPLNLVLFRRRVIAHSPLDQYLRRVYRLLAFSFPAFSLCFIFWTNRELCIFGTQQNTWEVLP